MGALRDAMIDDMRLHGYSKKTIDMYVKYMARYAAHFGKSPLEISPEELRSFFIGLIDKGTSPSTLHNYYSAIKVFYRFHDRDWYLDRIPPPKIPFRIPSVMDQSEIQAVLDRCRTLRHKTIFTLIYSAGLRVSEAANLRCSDIDFKRRIIHVRSSKNGKDRFTILGDKTAVLIERYLNRYKPKSYLFYSLHDIARPIPIRQIQDTFHKLVLEAKIQGAHVHTLRHSFATHLLEADTNLFYIMKLLGHTSINSTIVYLHMQRLDMLSIVSPLDASSIVVDRGLELEDGQYLLTIAS
jgi:integrase/recombinase XerD